MIVSNPPYVADGSSDVEPHVLEWEPASALFSGVEGLDDLRIVVAGAPPRLVPGGWLVVEHGHDQGAAVRTLFEAAGFESTTIETTRDLAGHERITRGRRPG